MKERLLFLLLALALEPRTCFAQAQERTVGMAGELHCVKGVPVVLPPLARLQGLARDENALHESMHVQQFKAECEATRERWLNDPEFRLRLEVQAYCYGIQVYRDTAYVSGRWRQEVQMLSTLWGNAVGFETIYAELDHWCRGGP